MHNSTGIITGSCERICLELPLQAHSFPLWKGVFPKTAITFYIIEQPLNPVPRDPIWIPPAIFGLLNAFSRATFFNGRDSVMRVVSMSIFVLTDFTPTFLCKIFRRIPETWANQRPIESTSNQPKNRNIVTGDDLPNGCGRKWGWF